MNSDSSLVVVAERIARILGEPTWYDIATVSLTFITTVLWGVYVIYTRKTFIEIKQQNELSRQGYLVMEPFIRKSNELKDPSLQTSALPSIAQELHGKWEMLLKQLVPQAIQDDQYVVLRLRNSGGSDIIWLKISVQAHVDPGGFLQREKFLHALDERWEIEQSVTIRPGDDVELLLSQINAFPRIRISWKVEYRDIRDSELVAKAGKTQIEGRNSLADPSDDHPLPN